MKKRLCYLVFLVSANFLTAQPAAQTPAPPKVLLFFSLNVEADHMLFATDAIKFVCEVGDRHDFRVEATSNWTDLNEENLKQYKLIVWLNDFAPAAQQAAFQRYMEGGGAWFGFHYAGFNMSNSKWTWFRQFIGGSFGTNGWPPLPARLVVDDTESPVTRGIPKSFAAPANEWYSWRPSPRLDKDIHVLLSLDPTQYPLGIKSLITTERDPDVPVVWTNTKFKMLYANMGHGDKIFNSPTQNKLFENGILWLLGIPNPNAERK
jgi:type 1 glutamine amidotransferase